MYFIHTQWTDHQMQDVQILFVSLQQNFIQDTVPWKPNNHTMISTILGTFLHNVPLRPKIIFFCSMTSISIKFSTQNGQVCGQKYVYNAEVIGLHSIG